MNPYLQAGAQDDYRPDGARPFDTEHGDDTVDRLYRDRTYRRKQLGLTDDEEAK